MKFKISDLSPGKKAGDCIVKSGKWIILPGAEKLLKSQPPHREVVVEIVKELDRVRIGRVLEIVKPVQEERVVTFGEAGDYIYGYDAVDEFLAKLSPEMDVGRKIVHVPWDTAVHETENEKILIKAGEYPAEVRFIVPEVHGLGIEVVPDESGPLRGAVQFELIGQGRSQLTTMTKKLRFSPKGKTEVVFAGTVGSSELEKVLAKEVVKTTGERMSSVVRSVKKVILKDAFRIEKTSGKEVDVHGQKIFITLPLEISREVVEVERYLLKKGTVYKKPRWGVGVLVTEDTIVETEAKREFHPVPEKEWYHKIDVVHSDYIRFEEYHSWGESEDGYRPAGESHRTFFDSGWIVRSEVYLTSGELIWQEEKKVREME